MATVLIGADICPIEGNRPFFIAGDARSLLNDLLPEFQEADLVMANLECPLIEKAAPIPKTGPTFGEPSDCIKGIKAAGIDILGLANNHIMDHGASGLKNTLEVCERAGVATVGAGKDLNAARQILVRKIGAVRIGVLAVAEHEFSTATASSWGAYPLDSMDFVRNVMSQRANFDYLIVLLHGSAEFHVPTPRIQDTCRFMIEMGANAVVVQHPHVLGGYENYRHGHIVYGQGALIMDEAIYRNRSSFHEGVIVKLQVRDDATSEMSFVPFVQSAPVPGARKLSPAKGVEFLDALAKKSKTLLDPAAVQAQWLKFCNEKKYSYLSSLMGHNRVVRKLNSTGAMTKLAGGMSLLRMRNIVCCETHREAVETIFNHGLL